jgi:hypothetical protein
MGRGGGGGGVEEGGGKGQKGIIKTVCGGV